MHHHLIVLFQALALCLLSLASPLPAAQLSGWIEAQPTAVDLTAEGSLDWIQGGYNGGSSKLVRKNNGANLISALTVARPNDNGALVRSLGATLSWSDGSPDAVCSGTTNGIHALHQDNSISFSVPVGTGARTIRIYSASVNSGMQFRASLSDGSAPEWVNEDWYAVTGTTITPRATFCFAAASAGQSLTVTITNISGGTWPSVGIHAVTLQEGATIAPPLPAPPAPTGLRATAGNGQVKVQWNQGPFASSYNIYRSTSATIPATPWRSGILPIQLNYDSRVQMLGTLDATASNGSTWHYWVEAVNAGGRTRAAANVTATPAAPTSTAITTSRLLKILPIGDSITYGYEVNGGYRQKLQQNLLAGGYQFQFVGRLGYNSSGMAEPLHEGWLGKSVQYLRDSVVDTVLPDYQPDLILLMIGTNNVAYDGQTQVDVDNALIAYDDLLTKIFTLSPNATVIVSPLLPIQGRDLQNPFNQALHTKITTLAGQGRRVSWCSQMSAITLAHLADIAHPNAEGYTQMGDAWYAAIRAVTTVAQNVDP